MGVFVISLKTFSEQKTLFSNLKRKKLDDFFFFNKTQTDKKRIDYPFCVVYLLLHLQFFFSFFSID